MTRARKPKNRSNVITPFTGCAQIYHQRWYVRFPRGKFHLHRLLRRALSVLRQPKEETTVEKFEECPIRESEEMYNKYFSSSLRDTAMQELGVGTTRDMDSVITGIFFPGLRCKAYTWQERINIWRGKGSSTQFPVAKDSTHFNAFSEVPSLRVPIFFFAGKYDYTCSFGLQYEYYEQID